MKCGILDKTLTKPEQVEHGNKLSKQLKTHRLIDK